MIRITSFADIAGRVSDSSINADKATVGNVCFPSGALVAIRRSIPLHLPKWRDATDDDVRAALSLVLKEALAVTAGSLDKESAGWKEFCEDSREVHAKTAGVVRGSIGMLKAGTIGKMLLFAQSGFYVMLHTLETKAVPRTESRRGLVKIDHQIVLDDEIQGHENRAMLDMVFGAESSRQSALDALGIEHHFAAPLHKKEQEEPLLLLADYVAGIVHFRNSKSRTLESSAVSESCALDAYNRLSSSKKFYKFTSVIPKFFEMFPDFREFSSRTAESDLSSR